MPRAPAPVADLRARLEAVARAVPSSESLARDPVRFPRAYRGGDPVDVEVAAVLAAQLAYGRVDLFGPVIARLLAICDAHGGPAAFVRAYDGDLAVLDGVLYRWNRPEDFALLFRTLRAALDAHGSLGALFPRGPARASLGAAIDRLRALAPPEQTRGFRTWLAHPDDGSACKRWNMLLRWMVRPADGVDLGLWAHLSPRDLVIPLDTHVMRLSRFLGLTRRNDAGWRTAEEVTAALRRLDPEDPVRFDFALAHLGISKACKGWRDPAVCPACPLDGACRAPEKSAAG